MVAMRVDARTYVRYDSISTGAAMQRRWCVRAHEERRQGVKEAESGTGSSHAYVCSEVRRHA